MKKILVPITFLFLLNSCYTAKQAEVDKVKNEQKNGKIIDTLTTSSGFKVFVGQKIKIGTGAMPDGDFKYIRVSATSVFNNFSENNTYSNQTNSLSRHWSGHEGQIVRIDRRGNKKAGYIFYPIMHIYAAINEEVDIENAIAAGEIIVPEEYQPKQKPLLVEIKQNISVADELTKLKKLRDDGVLSEEEYQAQKKKLLEK